MRACPEGGVRTLDERPNCATLLALDSHRYITLYWSHEIARLARCLWVALIVQHVKSLVRLGETAAVILDSRHTKSHVLAGLEAYHELVTPSSYIVATDGSMQDLHDVPRGVPEWRWDHPAAAASEFVARHPEFVIEQPAWPFNESELDQNVTHWPGAWLFRH